MEKRLLSLERQFDEEWQASRGCIIFSRPNGFLHEAFGDGPRNENMSPTPELAPPLLTTTPHQRSFSRFNGIAALHGGSMNLSLHGWIPGLRSP
ncbi:hypothetical protein TNCV_3271861 [Trichonephila clavipes]|nr:hypothetical protein TNCV_3271861 [Trichonephila clavipes]